MIYASRIVKMESGKEYADLRISTIHPLITNKCDVMIENHLGDKVIFPKGSFIGGALYNIHVKKITFDPKRASFVGYGLNLKI